jgi:predicted enzyme related to lactoylglutathione lyase
MKMIASVQATNLTVENVDQVTQFYRQIFPEASVSEGVFAGIGYKALIGEDGEVEVCLFQAGDGNPLAPSFPTIMVENVPAYLANMDAMKGKVLVPENPCPCTGMPFAICADAAGNQFMIKQPLA